MILLFEQIDALQYLHESEYVHADIKAANILQGYQKTDQVWKIFTVDELLTFILYKTEHLNYQKKKIHFYLLSKD